ncbi:hypothetical protein LEM8419_03506 [Neolewinella maritima]|uniref:Uncharacterized protein n=1 Tax=Neolewinella maritima TaxID=1383882 RepID=A0ABN8F6S1_9BACT|nr:hypothetical protein [Neolewinella maritima]CAH1002634.1 hypothetical protein LEM8419_03506 [Neolewinella maritima]
MILTNSSTPKDYAAAAEILDARVRDLQQLKRFAPLSQLVALDRQLQEARKNAAIVRQAAQTCPQCVIF